MTGEATRHSREGVVSSFDEHAGWGSVRGDDGEELYFHCTAVADGSRTIAEGAEVDYVVVPGHRGRWEARSIRKLP